MKLLTVVVPTYNTEKYIRRCLDSVALEELRSELEVLVVSDGSLDASAEIADEYAARLPDCIKVIRKENGGHGSTINTGLSLATGKYFRVLDSDDWFDIVDFKAYMQRLKTEDADAVICNYRKEFVYESRSEFFSYPKLQDGKTYEFDKFDLDLLQGEYFVMATTAYKTELLKKSGLSLLEKTFYVDMQFNVVPITELCTFTYYDLDVYRYFIGRPDQSMNLTNFVRNQDHHKKMVHWIVDFYTKKSPDLSGNKREYLQAILVYTLNTHYTIYCEYDKDHRRAYREITEFDRYLLETNPTLYDALNTMAYIRYNRKSKFKGVKVSSRLWKKCLQLARIIKHRGN